jgi:hypothetical protein
LAGIFTARVLRTFLCVGGVWPAAFSQAVPHVELALNMRAPPVSAQASRWRMRRRRQGGDSRFAANGAIVKVVSAVASRNRHAG